MSLKIAAVLQRGFCMKIRAFKMFALEVFSKFGLSRYFILFLSTERNGTTDTDRDDLRSTCPMPSC